MLDKIFWLIVIAVGSVVGLFILSFIVFFVIVLAQRKHIPVVRKKPKREPILKRLLLDFPLRYWNDFFDRDPDDFPEYGLHLFCGEQGSGKTVALTEFLMNMQKTYPMLKVGTNYCYNKEDFPIAHWKDVVGHNNGQKGTIVVIDEIQNWFNSLQSKDFPIDMITEISQQRKQRKIIVGTSQVFDRVAKPIREQVTVLYRPLTIAGCLTIVRVSKPRLDSSANVIGHTRKRNYFFIQSKELRDMFDTLKKIERMSEDGFSPRPELQSSTQTYVTAEAAPKRSGRFGRKE